MTTETIQVFHACNKCGCFCSGLDKTTDKYVIRTKYWIVRDPSPDETWETCNPENPFFTYCYECHATRLLQGIERVKNR